MLAGEYPEEYEKIKSEVKTPMQGGPADVMTDSCPTDIMGGQSNIIMEVTVMNKYVSLDKRSKKAQREYHAKQRRTWGELNPVTRSVPSRKTYNRKKEKQRIGKEFRNGFDADLFFRKLLTLLRIRTILRIRSIERR